MKDAVEVKYLGIGLESMTVGSNEFYMDMQCRTTSFFASTLGTSPNEVVGDKISSVLQYIDGILLHVTRPIRWDSDHVVTLNEVFS
jgi:L-rhamnose isomerase